MNHQVILFDGVCNVCNGFVQFVIRYDKKQYFKFASQQSEIGSAFLNKIYHNVASDSIVLIDGDKTYSKSMAVLKIIQSFGGIWKTAKIFEIIPRVISDFCYDVFAKYRYKLFGRKDECMIPTPEIRQRFI
jgi:predicted DCC family thiol-disulfide oxidoreductase YuxK